MAEPLTRADFHIVWADEYHLYFSHRFAHYELCIEPCLAGFDVALFDVTATPEIAEPRVCLKADGYDNDLLGWRLRSPAVWSAALEIANKLYAKYTVLAVGARSEDRHE